MGYPTTTMPYLDGTTDAISRINASTLNTCLQKGYDSRTLGYLSQALNLWAGYTGPMTGKYTKELAAALDAQWSEAWATEPSGKYAKDAAGNYPLAFFRDFINGDGGLGSDAPPVVA